ncbi:MAG TPA: hypothetical protein VFN67_09515, partial [Polyangiales bacterium]|nr:hypothetical protein [Polyangiales bacterium]
GVAQPKEQQHIPQPRCPLREPGRCQATPMAAVLHALRTAWSERSRAALARLSARSSKGG